MYVTVCLHVTSTKGSAYHFEFYVYVSHWKLKIYKNKNGLSWVLEIGFMLKLEQIDKSN